MKRIYHIIKTIVTCLLLVVFGSCEKYLEQAPDMRTDLSTLDNIGKLLVSAYPAREYITFAEAASDNVEDKSAALSRNNDEPYNSLYFWDEVQGTGAGTPGGYWNAAYSAISAANHALEALDNNLYDDTKRAEVYRGEALVARAYAHFMLVTFFARAYEIGGDNDSPGIPYVTTPETVAIAPYSRGTVRSVYEQIEKDLTEGLPLVTGGVWQVPKYHFTPQAAHAFAARFYLFKGEWDKVIEHASAVPPENDFKTSIRQYNGSLYNLTYNEHRIEYTKADKPWNVLLINAYSSFQRSSGFGFNRYSFGEKNKTVLTKSTVFGATFRNRYGIYSSSPPNYTTNKFEEYFYYTNVAAGTGQHYIMQPVFTTDEALLNRAEAYIHKDMLSEAIADLNTFASTRIVNYSSTSHALTFDKAKAYYNVSDNKEAIMAALLETKRIAFMQEGMRWFDILRHKITVEHNHIASDGTETFSYLEPDDNRRMFQIPQDAKISGIELNPR
ncbi:RagB/SusD family nutrient uptake outer membrane protein [Sphingobacterium sp. SGG-5]|uniref:RagB/SusD family nutrient uptake outer membrane protein n=1 Tax=Sphingobacterium sp. SGG-5 TaxID=2710881 RepID=UPI0013EA8812|nr:RagB/SusD family nutrient uptake outer membrane protein [Sphingobacterium sp. SGG-5]NGM60547.1 RagB/SusD family nutrient uptake outer membrane protein [Sphingobacterium sp. SGG-5]